MSAQLGDVCLTTHVLSRVVQRRSRVEDGSLGEVEDLGDVQTGSGGAFDAGLDFLCRT